MTCSWSVVVLLLFASILNVRNEEAVTYGAYNNRLEKVSACRGPKQVDLADYRFEVHRKKEQNVLAANITLKENVKLEMMKTVTYQVTKKQKSMVVRRQSKKPCDNQIMSPFINAAFNSTSCFVKKGNYVLELDVAAIIKLVIPRWFYGLYQIKVTVYSGKGNIACVIMDMYYYPKDKAAA